ncbi:hypothetical protein SAHL_17390 [Salinisphaera orenii YIM 95161]|uniref:Uncharacterized protein n=1 Tax=Salinisphaera orenii YIM 95161 TaxID=1051139 RepID=A0A423PDB7_9GAMM|nr:hypothetical protein SAHL_17390 [Salinisphaera halophila YIM 95161]
MIQLSKKFSPACQIFYVTSALKTKVNLMRLRRI